jgi:hypothetical protein
VLRQMAAGRRRGPRPGRRVVCQVRRPRRLGVRVVPFARSVVSIPVGILEVPLLRFTILTTGGSAVWNAVSSGPGASALVRYMM